MCMNIVQGVHSPKLSGCAMVGSRYCLCHLACNTGIMSKMQGQLAMLVKCCKAALYGAGDVSWLGWW